jgi:hypothetical protein
MIQPKWTNNPARQAYLIDLFVKSRGFCVYNHPHCTNPAHHYEIYIDNLVKEWISSDREETNAQYRLEYEIRHKVYERTMPLYGKFSGISKDIFYDSQPVYEIENMGISGITFKPYAELRLNSSNMRLQVDLGEILRPLSKNKKRKAIRHNKIPQSILNTIEVRCYQAVKHYLSH